MTLVFALLRPDHIIFASDRRHTSGDSHGRYVDDDCWKTEKIAQGKAMLGFAGHDPVEQAIRPIKAQLIDTESIQAAGKIAEKAIQEKYRALMDSPNTTVPYMEFLIAGFQPGGIASCFWFKPPFLTVNLTPFDADCRERNFVVIGKECHGALYVLHKCARDMTTIEAGIKLACFTLAEVGKYDKSVGGRPQVCVIHSDGKVEDHSDNLAAHIKWAADVGERIRTMIVSP